MAPERKAPPMLSFLFNLLWFGIFVYKVAWFLWTARYLTAKHQTPIGWNGLTIYCLDPGQADRGEIKASIEAANRTSILQNFCLVAMAIIVLVGYALVANYTSG
jgi:hypothetical protein